MAWGRLARAIVRGLRDRRGVAASEFALLLPVMLALLIGSVELNNVLLADRKVTAALQSGADLVAQARTISDSEMADIFEAMTLIMEPFAATDTSISVYSVNMDSDGNVAIDWQEERGPAPPTPTAELPAGLLNEGESVIVAEMRFDYQPLFGDLILGTFDIQDKAYLRPRSTRNIARVN